MTDDFNRASLGPDWPVTSGTQQIVADELESVNGVALHAFEISVADYYAKIDIVDRVGAPRMGTIVRADYATSEGGYYGVWNAGNAQIIRVDGDLTGTPTLTPLVGQLYSAGESLPRTLETSAVGSTIRFRIIRMLETGPNVDVNLSVTDTTYPSGGGHGVMNFDGTALAVCDDYEAGDFTTWHTGYNGAG